MTPPPTIEARRGGRGGKRVGLETVLGAVERSDREGPAHLGVGPQGGGRDTLERRAVAAALNPSGGRVPPFGFCVIDRWAEGRRIVTNARRNLGLRAGKVTFSGARALVVDVAGNCAGTLPSSKSVANHHTKLT